MSLEQSVRRVLIYRLGSLGDTVAAVPCFDRIAGAFPQAQRMVLTNKPVSSKAAPLEVILKDGGFIHGAIEYPVSLRSPKAMLGLVRRVRDYRADVLVYLAANRGAASLYRDLLFFRLCGLDRIVGAPRSQDLRRPRHDRLTGELEQESRRLARTITVLGRIDLDDPGVWDLRLTADERAAADAALSPLAGAPFVAVNTGGKAAEKDWGEANWAACLQRLGQAASAGALVFVGGAEDSERAQSLAEAWTGSGPTLDLCGRLSPRQSAAVLARAALFIGHDSGPLHLAAASGAPSLGLFGDYNRPAMWHPVGPKVQVIHEMRGMAAIEVETVVESALDLARQVSHPTR